MNGEASFALSYLLNSLWQVPLLYGVARLAARALRAVGPAAEHRVWVGALLLESLLPACSPPRWNGLTVLAAWFRAGQEGGSGRVTVVFDAATVSSALHLQGWVLAAAAMAYAAVCTYFFVRFLGRTARLARLRGEAVPLQLRGGAALHWNRCARRFHVSDAALATSSRIFSPATVGIWRKLLLLPGSLTDSPELPAVLAHECAHMRRNDFLNNLAYELTSVPVSYHPLCALTRRELGASREMVCDEMAAALSSRRDYAGSLLRLAAVLVRQPAMTTHAIGLADADTFERRVMKLTHQNKVLRPAHRAMLAAGCLLAGAVTCGSALALHMRVDTGNAASMPATTKTEVPGGVMAGNKLAGPNPVYPEAAKKAHIEGTVVLEATITEEGKVDDLKVVSGPESLRQSSMDAVSQWTYKPYLLNGEPVAVQTTVHVTYSLRP